MYLRSGNKGKIFFVYADPVSRLTKVSLPKWSIAVTFYSQMSQDAICCSKMEIKEGKGVFRDVQLAVFELKRPQSHIYSHRLPFLACHACIIHALEKFDSLADTSLPVIERGSIVSKIDNLGSTNSSMEEFRSVAT